MVNFIYPNLGESLINVLHSLGYEVILPATEACCGAPLRTLGLEEEAGKVARKNVQLFNKLNVEAVLSLCPTCTLQQDRIGDIFKGNQERMKAYRTESRARLGELRKALKAEIDAVLTPEQKAKNDEILRRFEEQRKKDPNRDKSRDRREGDPPPPDRER